MERNEWIASYLKGKVVTKSDLRDFFVRENNENKVKGKKIKDTIMCYITEQNEYTIELEPCSYSNSEFIVKEVYYE